MTELSAEPHIRLELLSQARFLAGVRALVGNVVQRLGGNETICGQISLAVDEALCNIINHGYDRRADGRIWINMWVIDENPPAIHIVIEDRARQVDPATIRSRDLDDIRPGGLGVYIIREVMDEVCYEQREGGGMRLTMRKRIVPAAAEPNASESSHDAASGSPPTSRTSHERC